MQAGMPLAGGDLVLATCQCSTWFRTLALKSTEIRLHYLYAVQERLEVVKTEGAADRDGLRRVTGPEETGLGVATYRPDD